MMIDFRLRYQRNCRFFKSIEYQRPFIIVGLGKRKYHYNIKNGWKVGKSFARTMRLLNGVKRIMMYIKLNISVRHMI